MKTLALEIRDRATFIAALAIEMTPANDEQRYLLWRSGYTEDHPCIVLTPMHGNVIATCDPYQWSDRTYRAAHLYIIREWATLKDGDVVDVEFILGERSKPKLPERIETLSDRLGNFA
jgi:hypothetical protein